MVQSGVSTDQQNPATPNATFLNRGNKGGLIQASNGSCKVVAAVEKAFKLNVNNTNVKCTNTSHLV